jgi:hypothetical protein
MGAVYPRPLPFDRFLEIVADRDALRGILFTLISSGFAAFHVCGPGEDINIGVKPVANSLARWEAEHTGVLTYSNHTIHKLDAMVRTLIELLDGTRDSDDLASELARVEEAPPREEIRAHLPHVLAHMAHAGLLAE